MHGVGADTPKGALLHRLIRSGTALFTAHTNADAADPGVSDALAAAIGVEVRGPLIPAPAAPLDKIITFIPVGPEISAVRDALSAAGAGHIGDYSDCSFATAGTGQFKPLAGAHPTIGDVGRLERVAETKLEMILPRARRAAVVAALRAAHPYEEPAFDVFEVAELPSTRGLGRIGRLPAPQPLAAFTERVAAGLPPTSWGVRAAGEPAAADRDGGRLRGRGRLGAGRRGRRRRGCLRHRRPAPPSGLGAPAGRVAADAADPGPDRRRALGLGMAVVPAGRGRGARGPGR